MAYWCRTSTLLVICLFSLLVRPGLQGVEYTLNYAQVGTSLSFPDNQGNSWMSTGESFLPANVSPQIHKAESVHLAFPLTGWNQAYLNTDWKTSSWLGNYQTGSQPWVYHSSLGWLFLQQLAIDSIWVWHEELGWFWTNAQSFPYVFQRSIDSWLFLDWEGKDHTLAYDFSNFVWFELGRPWRSLVVTNETPWGGTVTAPAKFRKGDSISLVAVAVPGYIFSGWSGDHAGSANPLILSKLDSSIELQASFTPISEAIHSALDRPYFDHLTTVSQKKQAHLELALFGDTELISTGESNPYEFSPQGNKETRLRVALGQVDSSEMVGVFETGSHLLTHPVMPWTMGNSFSVELEGSSRGIVNITVLEGDNVHGISSTLLTLTYPDKQIEKRALAQDNQGNVWLMESSMDGNPLQDAPFILLPQNIEPSWHSWSPAFGIPDDFTVILDHSSALRTSIYGSIPNTTTLLLHREKRQSQNETYAPGLGLIKISIP